MNPPPPKPERVVIADHSWRNTFIAVGAGLLILIFVGFGVMKMGSPVQGNKLSGEIIEKVFTPQPERQVSFSGRKIEGTKEIAGEYVLKVRVPPDNRIYEIPVEEPIYRGRKVGDTLEFIRPPSEQK